jgi:hypothetical protein
MPHYSLFGDDTYLPETLTSGIPYEIEALSPRETWGAGNGSTTILCRQTWELASLWTRDMVGNVRVVASGSSAHPTLRRNIPQKIGYYGDPREMYCSGVSQTDQGGNPDETGEDGTSEPPGLFLEEVSNWPRTKWCKYQAVFEVFPYRIRSNSDLITMAASAGATYAGAPELYRYVIRSRRSYSREQPIPAASTAGGFKVIVDPDTTPTGRKSIGQVGFRVISMADVTYKWIRIPIAWPPPIGWTGTIPATWPPALNPSVTDPTTLKFAKQSYIGKINSTYFDCADPQGYCYAPGTLLYTGFDDSYVYHDAAGDLVCDVTFMFKFKEGGWNYFLNAKGEWKEVSLDGTNSGTKPYETADFNNLFQYA